MAARLYRRVALWLGLGLVLACSQGALPQARSEEPRARLQYIERLTGGANTSEALPLLVVLHGLGDRPEEFVRLFLELPVKARIIAARAPDPWGEGSSWYPIDDEAQKPAVIRRRASDIANLIDHITKSRATRGKAVISGFSQGGVLSFAVAALHAERIALALPIAGSLPSELWPKPTLPKGSEIVAFHGHNDRRIPFHDAQRTVDAFVAAGANVKLKAYPGVGHAIPQAMQEELFAALVTALSPKP